MLKHDGYRINRKRVYRIWQKEGLQLPRCKVMKRRYRDSTGTLRRAGHLNEVWSYDFLEGRTERGGKLRMWTVLGVYAGMPDHPRRPLHLLPLIGNRDIGS